MTPKGITTNVTFRLPDEHKDSLEAIAGRYGVTTSFILQRLALAQIQGWVSFRDFLDLERETA